MTVSKGTATGSPVSNLDSRNNIYYGVASRKQGRSHVVDWYGQATVTETNVQELTLTYEGQYTRAVTQRLYVFNFSTGVWEAILPATTVSALDQSFTWSTITPASYISSTTDGVRMRVSGTTTGGSYACWGDLMSFTVEY